MKLKITVILSVLNCRHTLKRCIESVICQDYPLKELIIIDGGSTDGSVDVIRTMKSPAISHWESAPDHGIYHAWNKGLARATGDWINFMGADDYFLNKNVFGKVASAIGQCPPDTMVAYGQEAVVAPDGEILEINGAPWEEVGRRFPIEMSIPHPAVFHSNALFRALGTFDESFKIAGDYDLLLRVLSNGSAEFLKGVVIKAVHYGGTSRSCENALVLAREVVRAKRKNSIAPYKLGSLWHLSKIVVKSKLHRLLGPDAAFRIIDAYRCLTGRIPIWEKIYGHGGSNLDPPHV